MFKIYVYWLFPCLQLSFIRTTNLNFIDTLRFNISIVRNIMAMDDGMMACVIYVLHILSGIEF